jgi:benzoyl-CoA reductase subunit B
MYRIMEKKGVVSIGSLYTFGLEGIWRYDAERKMVFPRELPKEQPRNSEEACRLLADWLLNRPLYQALYHPSFKTAMMSAIARQWKVDGIILHLNRGCEGTTIGIAENRLGLLKEGFKVMTYEGNMADEREFDLESAMIRLEVFLDMLSTTKNTRRGVSS